MESSGSSIEEKAGQSVAPVQRLASISRRSAAAFARRGSGAADRRRLRAIYLLGLRTKRRRARF
jgi:hypothetical protein